jgi:hypothetical protein
MIRLIAGLSNAIINHSNIKMDSFLQMVKLYKFKAKHEEYFCNKSPVEYKELLSQNIVTLLDDRDQRGCRLFLAKMGKLTFTK